MEFGICWHNGDEVIARVVHISCLPEFDRPGHPWHSTTRPFTCLGSINPIRPGFAATVNNSKEIGCDVMYCGYFAKV